MAFCIFFLLTLVSSSHARDSQFFNKIPTTTNDAVPQQQDPTFLPDKDNAYGLFAKNPPSTPATPEFKQPPNNHLPKNYNPVSYVTQPEDFSDTTSFSEEKSSNDRENTGEADFRNYPTTNKDDASSYYNSGTGYGGGGNGFRAQGMSDTRFLDNGKYFYDVDADKYSNNHPYETLNGVRATNEYENKRNFYANADKKSYNYNAENYSGGGYQSQNEEEFLDEESLP